MFKTDNLYQNNEKWKNVKLGNSPETIGSWGGLLTSITMMLNGIGYPDEKPYTVNEKLKKAGGFLKALPVPPFLTYVWPNCIYRDITRCEKSDAPIAKIDAWVAAGKPVILQVDSSSKRGIQTHFVLVKEKKGDDYVLYDPDGDDGYGQGKEVLLTQRYKFNDGKLESEISAVLWFDFYNPELPKPPEATSLPVPDDKTKYTVYAAEERLVLRASDSLDGYPWKCLFLGTELTSLEPRDIAKPKLGVKGGWINVQDPQGRQGYVSTAFVTDDLSRLLSPTKPQPSHRKWCLKNVSLQHPVIEMRHYGAEGEGEIIPNRKPVKPFDPLFKDTVVSVLESDEMIPGWVRIMYKETYLDVKDWVTVRVTGLVNEADLDDYREDEREEFREFVVPISNETQTESSTDGQQDFYIDDKKSKPRYNMCGELSVAFVTGKDIKTVLTEWRDKEWKDHKLSKSMYDSMVWNADKPLERAHLENLFGVHEVEYLRYRDKNQGNIPLATSHLVKQTPDAKEVSVLDNRRASEDLKKQLQDYYFITNLKINTGTGDLEPSYSDEERNHWVVLDCVTRDGSRVELYNPFPNRREEYSFGEFYRSVGGDPNSGWWIKRKVNHTVSGQKASGASQQKVNGPLRLEEVLRPPTFKVAIDNQTENKRDAEQYLRIRGESSKPKTKLCGEFSVTFILGQSLDTSLKHWMEKQGKQAGLRELATLLQAYGFNRRKYILHKKADREEGKYYVVPNDERSIPSDPNGYFKSFSIDTVLEYWKGVQPELYNSILGGSRNDPTGTDDLITILKAYGYGRDDYSFYRPGSQEIFGYAPGRDAEVVGKTHFLLAGVNIHGTTGRLQPSGVPHWVVVTKITPRGNLVGGNGGWVELYNPFPNCWEEYSYREFMAAFRGSSAGSTLWIKKDISPVFTEQTASPAKGKDSGKNVKAKASQKGQSAQKGNKKDKGKKNAGLVIDDNPPLDVNRVICERLGVVAIPWEIGAWIRDEVAGDRFYAETLADALCESGILSIQGRDVKKKKPGIAVLTDPEFSDRLEAAIKKNMDSLAASQRDGEPASRVASAVLPLFTRSTIEKIKKVQKTMPVHTYQKLVDFRAWTLGLASKGLDPLEIEIKNKVESLLNFVPAQSEEFQKCRTILTRVTSQAFKDEIRKIYADSEKIKQIRKIWKIKSQDEISLSEVEEWIRGLTSDFPARKDVYRVKRWGGPGMKELGFDISVLHERDQSSNFQAIGLYNKATEFGAISNYLIIPQEDVLKLEALQVEDEYETKRGDDWLHQKMNWLCQFRGSIYMFAEEDNYKGEWPWRRREGIRWGTLGLGGNLVQVAGTQEFEVKLPAAESVKPVKMARLQGFKPSDWDRPLDDLLAEGLVHRCFCVNGGNDIADSPKGIVYTPFWSLEDWEFMPKPKKGPVPTSLWIPFDYLENPPE